MKRLKWTERKFNFDYPEGMFPFFLERLRGTAPRIKDIVSGLNDETLAKKSGTAWSVKEHIGHLIDLEELHDARLDDYLEKKEILRAADMQNRKTYEANHNSVPAAELITRFIRSREHFLSRI